MTWTVSHPLVTGSWEEGPEDRKIKKVGKVGVKRSCTSYALGQVNFFKKYSISYTISSGKNGTESAETSNAVRQSQQEGNRAMLHEGNTGHLKWVTRWAYSSLRAADHSPLVGKHGILRRWNYSFPTAQAQAPGHYWPCQAFPGFRQGTIFLLHTSGPQESLGSMCPTPAGKSLSWIQKDLSSAPEPT